MSLFETRCIESAAVLIAIFCYCLLVHNTWSQGPSCDSEYSKVLAYFAATCHMFPYSQHCIFIPPFTFKALRFFNRMLCFKRRVSQLPAISMSRSCSYFLLHSKWHCPELRSRISKVLPFFCWEFSYISFFIAIYFDSPIHFQCFAIFSINATLQNIMLYEQYEIF